jgi:cold shock CspA family protein/ribosome-associated translation inhibitor RaiA
MKLEPQITFRQFEPTAETKESIRKHVAKLDEICNQIVHCRVLVEMPHQHHRDGNLYQVRIDLSVPDEEIAVSHESAAHTESRDLNVAIRDAFNEAQRKLEDYVNRHRRYVKEHSDLPHAKIRMILSHADHGFLDTLDGREIYFHRNSVVNAKFDDLKPGTEVTFVEEQGEKGPQASTVHVVGRHHRL